MARFLSLACTLVVAVGACGDDGAVDPDASMVDGGRVTADGATDVDGGPTVRPPAEGLPVGIPTPTFGWELDTGGDPTIWVDNTNPACDDAVGTAAQPLCDLFRGGRSTTYDAGDVVHVLGGPYPVRGDYTLTMNGTETAPVVVVGQGAARVLFDGGGERANFDWAGSYGVIEHLDFFHQTRHRVTGDHLVLRDVAVHNPVDSFIDFNPVVSVVGHDVLIQGSEIFNNRRSTDTDSHGIQASEGSFNVWILDNELYNNNGDSFQGCHECFGTPPHHVYLGRNVMHDDRENAIDLKTIHDVVVSENVMYGYGASATSGGDAMVIGSNGFDEARNQGPRRVWVLHNEIRDSGRGIRIEGSEDVWIIGNVVRAVETALQIDDKPHRLVVVAANTFTDVAGDGLNVWGCRPQALTIVDNLVATVGDRHLDLADCSPPAVAISNNLFGGAMSVRVDGTQHGDVASLDAMPFATGNVAAEPMFEPGGLLPAASSPAVDSGAALSEHYDAFRAAFGPSIDRDRAGTTRPSGSAEDIGAYERP